MSEWIKVAITILLASVGSAGFWGFLEARRNGGKSGEAGEQDGPISLSTSHWLIGRKQKEYSV